MNYWIVQNNQVASYNSKKLPLLSVLETPAVSETLPYIIAAAGSGGKTTLVFHLLEEALKGQRSVLLSTTTHMFLPEALLKNGLALGTLLKPPIQRGDWVKCKSPKPHDLFRVGAEKELLLIEADGSRNLPLKAPDCHEPVIPPKTGCIPVVFGLSALGKPIAQVCHRYSLLSDCPFAAPFLPDGSESLVTPQLMGVMMRELYLRPLTEKYPDARIFPVWNQADTPDALTDAKQAARACNWPFQLITYFKENERIFPGS